MCFCLCLAEPCDLEPIFSTPDSRAKMWVCSFVYKLVLYFLFRFCPSVADLRPSPPPHHVSGQTSHKGHWPRRTLC